MYIHTVHLFITKYNYQNNYDYIIALFVCFSQAQKINGPQFFSCRIRSLVQVTKGTPLGESHGSSWTRSLRKCRWKKVSIDPPVVKNKWPWTDELHQIILNIRTWNYLTLDFTSNYIVKEKSEAINNLHHPIWRFGVPSMSSWCRQMSLWAALLTKTSMRQNTKNDFANRFRYTKNGCWC